MKNMTQEDWKKIEFTWNNPYSIIKMKIDGYDLTLELNTFKMKMVRFVFVNHEFKGNWLMQDCEIRKRFMRPLEKFVMSKKYREDTTRFYKKLYDKSRRDEMIEKINRKSITYYPWWISFKMFKQHIVKNNQSIELL